MEHHFNTDIAKEYGVNCAILISNISYWIHKNQCDNRHYYDGRYWTYISRQGMVKMFPYLSEKQIGYALQKLIDNDIIIVGNYNKNTFDRTKWYSFTDTGIDLIYDLTKGNARFDKRATSNDTKGNVRFDKRATCIDSNINNNIYTNRKPDIKPDNKGAKAPVDEIFKDIDFDFDKNLIPALLEFAKMRKSIKKPLTPYAMKLAVAQLLKMSPDVKTQTAIVNQSICNCWQGLFPLKAEEKKGQAPLTEMTPTKDIDELEKEFMRRY